MTIKHIKVGDKVMFGGETANSLTNGNLYEVSKVIEISRYNDKISFSVIDDHGMNNWLDNASFYHAASI